VQHPFRGDVSLPYTPCEARLKTHNPQRHSGTTTTSPLTAPESPHCTVQIGGGIGIGKRG